MNACRKAKSYWHNKFRQRGVGLSLPRDVSPLRYPGGKGSLKYFLADTIFENGLQGERLIEPFCGGGGATLPLLLNGIISELWLNDANPAIHAFWHAVLHDTDNFLRLMKDTPVTLASWNTWKEASKEPNKLSMLEYGFATFFLNRTNRSGLIVGGPIGGQSQKGQYKLDCRFNKKGLQRRIEQIADLRDQIKLSNLDAICFLDGLPEHITANSLAFLDPPYVQHGYNIYRQYSFRDEDHRRLADYMKEKDWRWIITYDDHPLIHELYSERTSGVLEYSYYMQQAKIGKELVLSSSICRLSLPDIATQSTPPHKSYQPSMSVAGPTKGGK